MCIVSFRSSIRLLRLAYYFGRQISDAVVQRNVSMIWFWISALLFDTIVYILTPTRAHTMSASVCVHACDAHCANLYGRRILFLFSLSLLRSQPYPHSFSPDFCFVCSIMFVVCTLASDPLLMTFKLWTHEHKVCRMQRLTNIQSLTSRFLIYSNTINHAYSLMYNSTERSQLLDTIFLDSCEFFLYYSLVFTFILCTSLCSPGMARWQSNR